MRMLVLAEYTKENKGSDNKTRLKHNFQFVELDSKNKPMGKAVFVSQDKAPEKLGLTVEAPYTCELFLGPMRTVFSRATGQQFTFQTIMQIKDCKAVIL